MEMNTQIHFMMLREQLFDTEYFFLSHKYDIKMWTLTSTEEDMNMVFVMHHILFRTPERHYGDSWTIQLDKSDLISA